MSESTPSDNTSFLNLDLTKVLPFRLENAIAILIVILAIVSRFYGLGDRVMSHDEVNHVVPAFDFSQGRGYNYDPMTHGPLQFHLIAASFVLFGDNDLTARIPVAVFSIATVLFALFAFRRYLGKMGALAAGVLFLISPLVLFYGRYARNEAFIVLWSVITVYAILRYLERGSFGDLMLFTMVNAFHFIDKSTAYIFAAEELVFLGGFFLLRLARQERFRKSLSLRNSVILLLGCIFFAGGAYMLGILPADATITARLPGLLFGGCGLIAIVFSIVAILQDTGSDVLRGERSFDLLVMLGTLVLPLLASFPMKLAGVDITDVGSYTGALTAMVFILAMAIPAIWLGLWWNGRVWAAMAFSFFAIFTLFYTTFFTNLPGLPAGFVRALGYWLEQQGVQRGSQPWYLYLLVELPVYEFLPFLGMILAIVIGIRRKLWSAPAGRPFVHLEKPAVDAETNAMAEIAPEPTMVPTLALLVFWSLAQLIAFSYAGEKMGWLTVHITTPMILACAWTIGYLFEKIASNARPEPVRWVAGLAEKIRPISNLMGSIADGLLETTVAIQQSIPGWVLTILAFLAILTARTAIQAAYYNYDYPFEYMVYAHGAPAPKDFYNEIEKVSFRATGDRNLVVAYDNNVRYPYWWYLRHYPNRIDFNDTPTSTIHDAAYIFVGEGNRSKVQPFLKDNYVEFHLARLWWPNQDYWGLKWDDVQVKNAQKKSDGGVPNPPQMNAVDYLAICWERVAPMFTDPQMRSAVFQVWLNRDFTQWSHVQNRSGYTLGDWSIADWMYVYIRKDYMGGYDGKAQPAGIASQPDLYQLATIDLQPNLSLGGMGSEPGLFSSPHGVAAAKDGSLYIADSFNHRIQHLSADGKIIGAWGTQSKPAEAQGLVMPPGTFNEPWGIAVGPDGAVYVADTWNNRIQKFSATGDFISAWGTGGQAADGPERFYGPRAIAVGADGRVFVADTGNKRIVVFDPAGAFITQFGGEGSETGQFNEPVGLALDDRGRVYVADTWNSRVQVFAPNGDNAYEAIAAWEVDGWYGQEPTNKPFLTVDSAYHVFLTDPTTCRVMEFSQTGGLLAVWGVCGSEAGQLSLPTGIVWSSASGLWVTDAKNNILVHYLLPQNLSVNPPAEALPLLPISPVTESASAASPTSAVLPASHAPITLAGVTFQLENAILAADLTSISGDITIAKGPVVMTQKGWMPKGAAPGQKILILKTTRTEGEMQLLVDLDLRLAYNGTETAATNVITMKDTAYWTFLVPADATTFTLHLPDGAAYDLAPLMKP